MLINLTPLSTETCITQSLACTSLNHLHPSTIFQSFMSQIVMLYFQSDTIVKSDHVLKLKNWIPYCQQLLTMINEFELELGVNVVSPVMTNDTNNCCVQKLNIQFTLDNLILYVCYRLQML